MNTILTYKWLKPAVYLSGGLLLGWLLFGLGSAKHDHSDHSGQHPAEANGVTWTCSMHPSVQSDEPGSCPICGMDLIPASNDQGREDDFSMVMSEAAMRLAQIQTYPAKKGSMAAEIWAPGVIKPDERQLAHVTSHFHGRIVDLYVNFTGVYIEKGQPMASIYSDDLITAQRELLEAKKMQDRSPAMYKAARQKLRYWDLHEHQIDEIEKRGEPMQYVDILAPQAGYVLERLVKVNDHISPGKIIYEIADLSNLWVIMEVFEDDVSRIKTGDKVSFNIKSLPGETFSTDITYIDPYLDPHKRTVHARGEIDNRDGRIKPEMLLSSTIGVESDIEELMVPASAVLWTGKRSIVYVKDTASDVPRFEAREVETGTRNGDYFAVIDGVNEGEEVVFHGAFRIDSEMQLADRFSMMNRRPGEGAVPAHQHGAMPERDVHEVEDFSSEVDAGFRSEFTQLVEQYLALKDALVESDGDLAANQAADALQALESIGQHRLDGDAHIGWMETYNNLRAHLLPAAGTTDPDEIRAEFRFLSEALIGAVKSFGVESEVYHQYCPMAFSDEGASWISGEEQIMNPYLPETMLMCGEVIERLDN